MILQFLYSLDIVIIVIISLVFSLFLFLTELLGGAAMFKWGLEAVDGRDEGFSSRIGTIFIILLINNFLPFIGLFIGWKFISSRHDLNYGESILAYIVYRVPMAIVSLLVMAVISGITFGIMFLIMGAMWY